MLVITSPPQNTMSRDNTHREASSDSETDTSESDYSSDQGVDLTRKAKDEEAEVEVEAGEMSLQDRIPPGQMDKVWKVLLQQGWTKTVNTWGRTLYMKPGYDKEAVVGESCWEGGKNLLAYLNGNGGWRFVNSDRKRKRARSQPAVPQPKATYKTQGTQTDKLIDIYTDDELLQAVANRIQEKTEQLNEITQRETSAREKHSLKISARKDMQSLKEVLEGDEVSFAKALQEKTFQTLKDTFRQVEKELELDATSVDTLFLKRQQMEVRLQEFKKSLASYIQE